MSTDYTNTDNCDRWPAVWVEYLLELPARSVGSQRVLSSKAAVTGPAMLVAMVAREVAMLRAVTDPKTLAAMNERA